jgi:hypothetical protein
MEPIESVATHYRNTRRVEGGASGIDAPEKVRDVPPELLDSLAPCLEIARGADEPPGGDAVVFRAVVLHR